MSKVILPNSGATANVTTKSAKTVVKFDAIKAAVAAEPGIGSTY
jgi:hypothetical protein